MTMNIQLPQPGAQNFDQLMRLAEAQISIEAIKARDRGTAAQQAYADALNAMVAKQDGQAAAIINAPYTQAVQAHATAMAALAAALGSSSGSDAVIAAHVRGISAVLSNAAPEA